MTHPQAALASPSSDPLQPQQAYDGSNGDFSSLDFLSFMGLDASTPQPELIPSPKIVHPPTYQAEAGPSTINANLPGSPIKSQRGRDYSTGRGRSKTRGTKRRGGGSSSLAQEDQSVTADPSLNLQILNNGDDGMEGVDAMGMERYGLPGEGYDAVQAGSMQQQLEQIHMQSPLNLNPADPQSPFHPLAQMYLISPPGQAQGQNQQNAAHAWQEGEAGDGGQYQRKWNDPHAMAGVLTPAQSGDIFPQIRPEMMSPMQLEILARGEAVERPRDFTAIALLSPAVSHQAGGSAYTSPTTHASYGSHTHYPQDQPINFGGTAHNRSPIEQLQDQQLRFQEQLILLQQQQQQLQATAAAVAPTYSSPYTPGSAPGSGHAWPVVPRVHGSHSAGSASTPSPGVFSPLTSPALDASTRAAQIASHHDVSPSHGSHLHHGPHPLSALSSPALNPVGSSGGGQQTLSPALNALNNAEMADPDYIRALVGFLEGQQQQQSGDHAHSLYSSPVIRSAQPEPLSSPFVGPSLRAGPNRQSLPAKSRPSPMMKPTTHGSHSRQSSASALPGHFSVPSSPVAQRYHPTVPGMSHLPPAVVDHHGVQQYHHSSQRGRSESSTPSPVDLSQIMPPPPVPKRNGGPSKLTPMTPASLMNLGRSAIAVELHQSQPVPAPKGQVTTRKAASVSFSPTLASTKKAVNGMKAAAASGGRRASAIRPAGVGLRAATKAAASAAVNSLEGETRRTSHKAAEQRRRDSLKSGFDELRLLLPPINTEALDPETGEPIPGSSAPRLLPKSSLVPDDNPNRGVSKVALLRFSNEYIMRLQERGEKRDRYIDKLREEVRRLRVGGDEEVRGDEGEDLLEMDMFEGEEEDFGDPIVRGHDEGENGELEEEEGEEVDEDMEDLDGGEMEDQGVGSGRRRR